MFITILRSHIGRGVDTDDLVPNNECGDGLIVIASTVRATGEVVGPGVFCACLILSRG